MARPIPEGSEELTFEQALGYHTAWTPDDRHVVRDLVVRYFSDIDPYRGAGEDSTWEVLTWYVPPSGGYVAGYRFRERGLWHSNVIYLYPGYVSIHPEDGEDVKHELSTYKPRDSGLTTREQRHPAVCQHCMLAHAGDCD